ncbi:MAG: MoaD/ThiS family protein [Gammaproteobacteria bacterium]|nr:MoaD/ThiS family protein [Gammaproteobacteria bacterium]MYD01956.1 MoaD/ThiS family protein [Gammaproteobacteria bacterium]MYI25520.1 MoaD/ThiS family protein [Gammaproteobacteria bacterium]
MSSVIVRIPTPLRGFAEGQSEIAAEGADVGAVLSAVGAAHPELLARVMKDDGQPREFVNIYLGSDNVRTLDGMDTPVGEGDVLSILPAVAGGAE